MDLTTQNYDFDAGNKHKERDPEQGVHDNKEAMSMENKAYVAKE